MSEATSSRPTYLYKLVPSSTPPPSPLPSSLPLSDLDTHSGFIHLSTSRQVPRTLKRFFADESRVYVLRIPYAIVEKDIKWEDPKGTVAGEMGKDDVFAHLYNGKLGEEEVESVMVLENDKASWDESLKEAESWLEY